MHEERGERGESGCGVSICAKKIAEKEETEKGGGSISCLLRKTEKTGFAIVQPAFLLFSRERRKMKMFFSLLGTTTLLPQRESTTTKKVAFLWHLPGCLLFAGILLLFQLPPCPKTKKSFFFPPERAPLLASILPPLRSPPSRGNGQRMKWGEEEEEDGKGCGI